MLDTIAKMNKLSSHEKCDNESCLWPSYHKDVKEMMKIKAFQNVKIDNNSGSAMTRFAKNATAATLQTDPIKQTHDTMTMSLSQLKMVDCSFKMSKL